MLVFNRNHTYIHAVIIFFLRSGNVDAAAEMQKKYEEQLAASQKVINFYYVQGVQR